MRSRRAITKANALLILLLGASTLVRSQQPVDELTEIVVRAPEPRFVAPTRRDKIGRIWAPVFINGNGPFRLVLDTGANHSAITASVALALGLAPDPSKQVLLRGVTGNAIVPTVRVDSFAVGDVILTSATLPIIADALGGAEGVLGTDGFAGMRIYIDFKHDMITISRSHDERVPADFTSVKLEPSPAHLLITRAQIGDVRVHAIIDTGGQATIGNEAMRVALLPRRSHGTADHVIDVTATSQDAQYYESRPIQLGKITIQGARISYGDMHIFEHWHLIKEPAVLIGMDVIGLLDVFIIDYRRRDLVVKLGTNHSH
jgi:predicted aspartyl protease